jgi:hypothetical protein
MHRARNLVERFFKKDHATIIHLPNAVRLVRLVGLMAVHS